MTWKVACEVTVELARPERGREVGHGPVPPGHPSYGRAGPSGAMGAEHLALPGRAGRAAGETPAGDTVRANASRAVVSPASSPGPVGPARPASMRTAARCC